MFHIIPSTNIAQTVMLCGTNWKTQIELSLNEIPSCNFTHTALLQNSTSTVKSRLSERRLSETNGLFEDDRQSRLFYLSSIAIKLPIIRISIIRKKSFLEVIRRSRLKKLLLNYPSRFEVQMSRMLIMISLFGRV